jgi:ribosomal protein RSM22 (predicted rRNA methylase)
LLDIGAGPGTALWAAADCWPGLADAVLVEASPIFRACGKQLAAAAHLPRMNWRAANVAREAIETTPRDLVTIAYLLNEVPPEARRPALARAWEATADTLIVIEPGTPAGWQRILAARRQLIEAGGHVIAPCPHAQACPLVAPDWCHFAERVARSRLHRQAKGADVPWEDEKFSYVAVSRQPAPAAAARVIARPRKASGRVTLKLCRSDGSAGEQLFSRRDGELYKRASRSDWGSLL